MNGNLNHFSWRSRGWYFTDREAVDLDETGEFDNALEGLWGETQ